MSPTHLDALAAIVGREHVLHEVRTQEPYLVDWSGRFRGPALAVVRPADVRQVAAVMRLCAQVKMAVVPQGGNTGLCGGSIPIGGDCIVLQLGRLNRIRQIDAVNNTMTVEAGVLLAHVQQAARDVDRLFPLSLAAEGSCTVGGILATNAGGTAVLRYGNARALCLGLEVVTPGGEIWNGLRALRKDNTGYTLRDLYIGSEGTLGVITAAVLELFPRPLASVACMVSVPGMAHAIALFEQARARLGSAITAFELMCPRALAGVRQTLPQVRLPPGEQTAWRVLLEVDGMGPESHLCEGVVEFLAGGAGVAPTQDVVIATSAQQRRSLWAVREAVPVAQNQLGAALRYDLSLPVSALADFVDECAERVAATGVEAHTVVFGHVGDGNLHFNIRPRALVAGGVPPATKERVDTLVYELLRTRGGSISAEHGIGQAKVGEVQKHKQPLEMELMKRIKLALDPQGLMNPGKVLQP